MLSESMHPTLSKAICLSELVDVKHGFAFSGEGIREDPPGSILLTPGNFAIGGGFKADKFKYFVGDIPADYVLHEGDLIVTMTDLSKQSDTLGYPALVPRSSGTCYLHNQRLGKIIIRQANRLDKLYLYYVLCSSDYRNEVLASATGTTVKHTSPSRILSHKVCLPSLPVQKRIADILGSLDDKIELNRKMNETLESMARALFKSWFVDFDPVVAKSEGRQPVGMDAETAKLFPDSFEDSEIGRIPKGWKVGAVDSVAAVNSLTLGKSDILDTIEYVEISEVHHGEIDNTQFYARGTEPSRARRRLQHGDTVMSTVRPDRGSYFLCLHPPPNLIASTGFAVLSPTTVPWSYLHAGLTQAEVFEHLGQHADGGAYPAVRPELIGHWTLCIPDNEDVLKFFHKTCAPLFEMACSNRKQVHALTSTRDALLPRLLSGELAVATD